MLILLIACLVGGLMGGGSVFFAARKIEQRIKMRRLKNEQQ